MITRTKVIENNTVKGMDNYSPISVGIISGLAIDLFRRFPKDIPQWCYRIVCAIFAAFLFAPFVIESLKWASTYYAFLGFANPTENKAVEPFVYCLTILATEPTLTLIYTLFEVMLPNWIKRKLNGHSEEN